jgi:biopolymer transport protein ExbB
VLAYNYGLRQMRLHVAEMDDFATDFLHLAMKTGFKVE